MSRGCCNECGYKADYIIDKNNYEDNGYEDLDQVPHDKMLCGACYEEKEMKNNFKPIHFYNHSTNESFQITSREGLINWINDFTENHNAFDTYEELKERCLEENEDE